MAPILKFDRCCNPFNEKKHLRKKGLRFVSPALIIKKRDLTKKHLICDSCRKKIASMSPPSSTSGSFSHRNYEIFSSSSGTTLETGNSDLSVSTKLPVINQALQLLGNSPIQQKQITPGASTSKQLVHKTNKVVNKLKNELGIKQNETDQIVHDFTEMVASLKKKFHLPRTTFKTRVEILTLMPKHWSICKVAETMKCSYHLAKVAKDVAAKAGVLSKPNKKIGKPLSTTTKSLVVQFYESDEISVMMPGKKDFLSVKNELGKRVHRQKKLVVGNLREIYHKFKAMNPEVSIGFSSFANLRPEHCVVAGTSGTHTTCVCSIHQNFQLLMLAIKLPSLTRNDEYPLETHEDALMLLICRDFRPDCYLGNCEDCPGVDFLYQRLTRILAENEITDISYKTWVSKPRCTLETVDCDSADFVKTFCDQAKLLLPHSFITKQQSSYLKFIKNNLKENECVLIVDFAENYAFVVQNAASGFHWNNNQATVYPVVIYYMENKVLTHKSLCIISDCLHHDAIAVYAYSRIINDFVKTFMPHPTKFFYFSDGAPQQFKNYKNFVNILHHERDFNVSAEWHFFTTAHGKGPCDGIGGSVKRYAARASLQLSHDQQILTPRDLYEWASKSNSIPSISTRYYDAQNYSKLSEFLDKRFRNTKPVPQTLKLHCIIPNGEKNLIKKRYSFATEADDFRILRT